MTSEDDLHLVICEIDRQLHVLSEQTDSTNITLPEKVVIRLPEDGNGYGDGLKRLRKVVLDFPIDNGPPVEPEKHRFSADLSSFLWKILAFSSPSLSFIQPEIMLQKELAMCVIRRQGNDILESTCDSRVESALSTWASREKSSIILIRGSSQSTNSLRYLSCEVVNQLLSQGYATACILNNADIREHFKDLGAGEVLRQIACQVLRTVSANLTMSLFTEILRQFHAASTDKDWFCILELMMRKLASLFIVIDASVLQNVATVAGLWMAEFDDIFSRLANTSTACVKIMISTNRKIDIASKERMHAHIEASISRGLPENTSRLTQSQRRIRLPLPFFSPIAARVGYEIDTKVSPQHPDDGGESIKGSRQPLKDDAQCCGGNTSHSSVMFKQSDIMPLNVQPKDEKMILNVVSPAEADQSMRHFRMMHPIEYQRRQEVHVAIMCALSWEADAVEVLCDHVYDVHDFGNAPGDSNIYSVVQIGRHRAVILYMPAMGKSSAAASGMNCLHSFPKIRLTLLTGICGGIPSPYTGAEILLGDVIVSDRLVQYDYGRQFPEGFKRKDTNLDNARKPLRSIAAFLSKLKTRVGSDRLSTRMYGHLHRLRTKSQYGQWATYPGISSDVSFEATYPHKHHNGDCEECDTSTRSVCAAARETHCALLGCDAQRTNSRKRHQVALQASVGSHCIQPAVHFGAYASGDIVMKSGEDRDKIGRREKVIAFEMEGAGVWDDMPTIIVKGVCDYADSHKNKDWQKYAATTAAACVKALLEDWPTQPQRLLDVA
ncbi:hypothetical protein PFICI_07405 [Pestalotiopsis fici W106-1]|uniref:Nucleoside phosphorylase domain-containing protein n=1 Tax=Pestalotiopsis fici (strain W106-1 / CGMCC3.15140) TaxID=1229662 RepID=W3X3Y4_PESFW|nr:uncharacterized protein PFICI_07405 [Pestalotiopsis fici W106-1]ETS79876.1 hypothetical protein PFICI_07405 [Pestalotiopsis fici W106-1]